MSGKRQEKKLELDEQHYVTYYIIYCGGGGHREDELSISGMDHAV